MIVGKWIEGCGFFASFWRGGRAGDKGLMYLGI